MKKRITVLAAACLLAFATSCGQASDSTSAEPEVSAEQEQEAQAEAEEIVISAETADYSGEGLSRENTTEETTYDADTTTITNIGAGSTITYTVPEGVDGIYDIYVTASKGLAIGSSQPYSVSINGSKSYAVSLDYEAGGDSEYADGNEYNTGSVTDLGIFQVKLSVDLESGDTIEFDAVYGSVSATLADSCFPDLGDLYLYPEGTVVATGYDGDTSTAEDIDGSDPLSGKTILWLGSSVTLGAYSGGYSMANALEDEHSGLTCEKYAISATTLVNEKNNSYVSRLRTIDPNKTPDLVIVQLSTNDATTGKEMGELTDSYDPATFDDTTITGAIETIISYVNTVYGCPVVFYTGSYYDSAEYSEMVQQLLKIQEKWGIGVIDMFNDEEMIDMYGTDEYNGYMYDEVHPNREGYVEWWAPVFDEYLTDYFTNMEDNSDVFETEDVVIDGESADVELYNAGGQYYVNIESLAGALAGTDKAYFSSIDDDTQTVSVTTGMDFDGEEIILAGDPDGSDFSLMDGYVFSMDEVEQYVDIYKLDDATFCKLGNLVSLMNLGVSVDEAENTIYLDTLRVDESEESSTDVSADTEGSIPEQYTKCQTVTYDELGIDVTIAMNDDETEFYLSFDAFGESQILYGTVDDGDVNVEYDMRGFFTGDAPAVLALADPDAWEAVASDDGIPAEYTKSQTVTYEDLGIDVLVAMDDDETMFYMTFDAFGEAQLLYGTVADGVVSVEYDMTGFFTSDAATILELVDPDAWE